MFYVLRKARQTPADTDRDNASDDSGLDQNESLKDTKGDLAYDDENYESLFHWRTVVACVAMLMLNFVQVVTGLSRGSGDAMRVFLFSNMTRPDRTDSLIGRHVPYG